MAAVLRFAGPEQEDRLKGHLALADLSCLPRLGLKGAGVLPWLRENGLQTAEALYAVRPIEDHGILVRIDSEEVFLEDGLQGRAVSRILRSGSRPTRRASDLPGGAPGGPHFCCIRNN